MDGKTDIRRTLLTIGLIAGVWVVYTQYFMPKPPPAPPAAAPAATAQNSDASKAAVAPSGGTDAAHAPGAPGSAAPVIPKPAEEKVVLDTKAFHAVFSSYGGKLEQFVLKSPQYQEKVGTALTPVDLARAPGGAFASTLEVGGKVMVPRDAAWRVAKRTTTEVEFIWESLAPASGDGKGDAKAEGDAPAGAPTATPTFRASKRFTLGPGEHELAFSTAVTNSTDKAIDAKWTFDLMGIQREVTSGGGFGRPAPNVWSGVCFTEKLESVDTQTLAKKGTVSHPGNVNWVGTADKYFMLALVPDGKGASPTCELALVDAGTHLFRATFSAVDKVAAGQTENHAMAIFAGPKLLTELDAVHIGAHDPKLGEALDYGWWSPISRVMLWILVGVHKAVRSWGLAIIALTLLVRLLMYPLTKKGLQSGREMAKLKPQMEALQKRYKDDKQRLNVEVMNLYKTHGINPLGGCLPMVVQLPIWMALYRTLGNAVELYRSNFLWMPDLTQADPFYITPVLTGVLMFVQQKMTPMPTDNEQQKIMMYTMPVVFTVMSLWFPAGLTIYILTSTLLGMAQQWWMNKQNPTTVLNPARAG